MVRDGFLPGGGDAALAQHDFRFADVAVRFGESALALHHSGPGPLPELLHQTCTDFRHIDQTSTPALVTTAAQI